jgi:hypothetical protein
MAITQAVANSFKKELLEGELTSFNFLVVILLNLLCIPRLQR